MIPLRRAAAELIRDAIKAALMTSSVPGHEDALRVLPLAQMLAKRPKLGRKIGVYEEDLHVFLPC